MTASRFSLTESQANALWNWVLAKQGLSQDSRLDNAPAAADLALGLHAARLPSPFATAVARTNDEADLAPLLGPVPDPQLVTVRCMRKTLHALPPQLAATALAATRHYRLRDTANLARRADLRADRFEAAQRWLVAHLAAGPLSHREIEARGGRYGFSTAEARLALKWCWERGLLSYRNGATSWHRERRLFGLMQHSHPDVDPDLDEETSKTALLQAYFQRYGPATVLDAAWWSGLGQQRVRAALHELDVIAVQLPWAARPAYLLTADWEAFRSAPDAGRTSGLNFLAHEDVALKAYFETRGRYLGPLPQQAAFNQIGEVLPTVIWDGQVIGLWRWDHRRQTVYYRHFSGLAVPATVRQLSRRTASRLRERLRLGYVADA